MRKHILGAALVAALVVPATAVAKPPTPQHVRQYERTYHAVRHQYGATVAGCNLIERRGSCHVRATDQAILRSLGVLDRILAPPLVVRATAPVSAYRTVIPTRVTTVAVAAAPTPSIGGLAACIIQHESGGNAQAVNGKYSGIGQWQESTWLADGGGRYAPTPTGASYAQQASVLNAEGSAGMRNQQGQYDGC